MSRFCKTWKAFFLLGLFLLPLAATAQAPNAGAVVQAGKRATAFVDTPDGEGTAYCVSTAGVFATDAHVVEGFTRVRLVLYPGEREQVALSARVSHSDDFNDMALLVIDPPLAQQAPQVRLTALPLGREEDLIETMPVAVFGFPLGTLLANNENDIPSITITTGHLTALRKEKGVLKELQLDAAVNPGNSGGPVLNSKGEVIGMIQWQIEGANGLNFAIPVTMVRKLMMIPEVVFDPAKITIDQRFAPQEFTVRVLPPPLPVPGPPVNYTVALQIGNGAALRDVPLQWQQQMAKVPGETVFKGTLALQPPDYNAGRPQFKLVVKQDGRAIMTTTGSLVVEEPVRPGTFGGNFGGPFRRPPTGGFGGGNIVPFKGQLVQCVANGHWFQVIGADRGLTWDEAKAAAEREVYEGMPGHLATITTEAEQQLIYRFFAPNLPDFAQLCWMGAYQPAGSVEPLGGWRWITGEPWNYTVWNRGEPNDANNGEDTLQFESGGRWNDSPRNAPTAVYLVEYEPRTATTPGGTTPGAAPGSTTQTPLCNAPADLVSWWRGEGNANDSVSGNDLALKNGATFVQGLVGQAFSFDGIDDYALAPYKDSLNLAPKGQFTLETWVRFDAASRRYKAIMVKAPPGGEWDYGIWCNGDNRFVAGRHNQDAGLATTVAQIGVWYHVAVTYQNGNWKTYLNGALEAETAGVFITQSKGGFALGRKGEEPSRIGDPGYFKGLIDEPTIFSRVLTAAEIKEIYKAGSVGKCSAPPQLPVVSLPSVEAVNVAFYQANGHYYEVVEGNLSWREARKAAEARTYKGAKGHLATVTSAAEQNFVVSVLRNRQAWLGALQPAGSPEPGGGFAWITGEPFTFTNWRGGEPNNVNPTGIEDTFYSTLNGGTWNDISADVVDPTINYYLVEYEPGAAVAPETVPQTAPVTVTQGVSSPDNKRFYLLVRADKPLNWDEAKDAAARQVYNGMTGHLATITSADEQNFLTNLCRGNQAWIGGFQPEGSREPAGGWRWVTGEAFNYTNWLAGEPNNLAPTGPVDAVLLNYVGTWNDTSANRTVQAYVVEFEAGGGVVVPGTPPRSEDGKTVVTLPAPATDVASGGGGRYLAFFMKSQRKLAIFDVVQSKMLPFIAIPSENVLLAAGQDKLIVVLNDQSLIQRWDLTSGVRETTAPLPGDAPVDSIALGHASTGPIAMNRRGEVSFVDLKTLRLLPWKTVTTTEAPTETPAPPRNPGFGGASGGGFGQRNTPPPPNPAPGALMASGDGQTFVAPRGDRSGLWIYSVANNEVRAVHNTLVSLAPSGGVANVPLPDYDGRWLLTLGGVLTGERKPLASDHLRGQTLIPDSGGSYFLGVRSPSPGEAGFGVRPNSVSIYSANDRRLLADLGTFDELPETPGAHNARGPIPLARMLYFLTQPGLVVSLNNAQDQITVRRVELPKILTGDYLFVSSVPPLRAAKGKAYAYQIVAPSKNGGVTYKVETAPDGLTISPTGLVKWTPLATFADPEANVVLSVRDAAGQETFHSFKIRVE